MAPGRERKQNTLPIAEVRVSFLPISLFTPDLNFDCREMLQTVRVTVHVEPWQGNSNVNVRWTNHMRTSAIGKVFCFLSLPGAIVCQIQHKHDD